MYSKMKQDLKYTEFPPILDDVLILGIQEWGPYLLLNTRTILLVGLLLYVEKSL